MAAGGHGHDQRAHARTLDLRRIGAVVITADRVLVDTARVHAAAWKHCIDEFLRRRARLLGVPVRPFEVPHDYLRFFDGRPRLVGLRDFLATRAVELPDGADLPEEDLDVRDGAAEDTLRMLAARKTRYFLQEIRRYGVAAVPTAVTLMRELRDRGVRTAVVSGSRTCREVVAAARLTAMVDVTVGGDGVDEYGDAGHCDPRVVDEAVRRLALPAEAVAVIDQTPAGVRAAHRCGVGMVVAVDPASRADDGGRAEELRAHGADLVVGDLAELTLSGRRPSAPPLR